MHVIYMVNTVNFKLDDELYFRLLELKVRLKAKGWKDFTEKLLAHFDNEPAMLATGTPKPAETSKAPAPVRNETIEDPDEPPATK